MFPHPHFPAKAALALALAVLGLRAGAAPVISEFMADNASSLTDGAGRNSDWIEIHNPTASVQDLAGWHLTDSAGNLVKWTFPSLILQPGGRLIVFASGDGVPDVGGALHTNFRLAAGGEYLALVAPDGVTKSTEFAPFPPQRENVSFGMSRQRTELLGPGATGRATAASAAVPGDWRGGSEPYADAAWMAVTNGIGYNRNEQPIISLPSVEMAAWHVPSGTVGNQDYGGTLGMDFSVEQALTVTALGAFDSGGDGFAVPIQVQLWSRNEQGTPDNFFDDTGLAVLAEATFSAATPGQADGGSRFINLAAPLALPVGTYTIVAWGYGATEPNGNSGIGAASWSVNDGGGTITFDGSSRYGAAGVFPNSPDGGPPNQYAAGTMKFQTAPADLRHTAYRVATGTVGNQGYAQPLGMDFKATRAVRVTSLGVFDSGSNGLATTLTAQLWQRNENGTPTNFADDTSASLLATLTFTPASPGTLVGGSRFKSLAAPLDLAPGAYTISASGYNNAEPNGNAGPGAVPWTTDGGTGAALQFVGLARYGVAAGFPGNIDGGPPNRYAAGTFEYFDSSDPMIATSVDTMLFGVAPGAYLRLPFTAPPGPFGSLELEMAWDDGFSAWLNGSPLASRRAPAPLVPTSTATTEGATLETLTLPATALISGANVLTIHGLNLAANDADFLCRARLTGISAAAEALYFPTPTPGGPEGEGVSGFVEPVAFSVPHGYYAAPFSVSLSTVTAGAEIRYTTDGSAPDASSTLYSVPVMISTTTPLRAAAFLAGNAPSDSTTATYLFAAQIVTQPAAPPGYPTSWNAIAADYAMEDNATDLASLLAQPGGTLLPTLRAQVKTSLLSLPSLCITASVADVFDSTTGIYPNPSGRGDLWERPCSAELIPAPGYPEAGFQINGGLQVMGLTSRNLNVNPRLPLRVIFSRRFGPPSLHYPLYPGNPVTRFDSIALRGNTRDNFGSEISGTLMRDQWTKQMQAAMGVPASSGRFVHLFINGLYWGIYNPTERPDGDFCEEHLGGDADEWDSVTLCCPNRAKSGTLAKWQELMTLCTQGFETDAKYRFLMGQLPDGTPNPAGEIILDIDNLITFLIGGYYHASGDWPGNFYAMRRRGAESTGWKFVTWDSDIGLGWGNPNADKTALDSAGWWTSSPGQIDLALRAHPEYRMRLADAVQRHFFNDGACTPAPAAALWQEIAQGLEPAMGAECARWGDYRNPLGTLTQWRANRDSYLASWFPNRTTTVLNQLRTRGLFPTVAAPVLNQHGGPASPGFPLTMSGPGAIYYTLNGEDPRLWGGAVRPGLSAYAGPVALQATATVKARVLNGSVWSALTEATFFISPPATAANLVISEVHFNPSGGDETEFLELMNTSAGTIDLSGVHFSVGLDFTFAAGTTLAAGARILIVRDLAAFTALHGNAWNVGGEFQNLTNLDNEGERLLLLAANGSTIADLIFDDDAPWPNDGDGLGRSMTLIQPASHPAYSDPLNWRASSQPHGTPGTTDAINFSGNPNADEDEDGLTALLEHALGSSDADGSSGPGALTMDPATGEALLLRSLTADDAVIILEDSTDLSNWDSTWHLTSREISGDFNELLRFARPPESPKRGFVRGRIP